MGLRAASAVRRRPPPLILSVTAVNGGSSSGSVRRRRHSNRSSIGDDAASPPVAAAVANNKILPPTGAGGVGGCGSTGVGGGVAVTSSQPPTAAAASVATAAESVATTNNKAHVVAAAAACAAAAAATTLAGATGVTTTATRVSAAGATADDDDMAPALTGTKSSTASVSRVSELLLDDRDDANYNFARDADAEPSVVATLISSNVFASNDAPGTNGKKKTAAAAVASLKDELLSLTSTDIVEFLTAAEKAGMPMEFGSGGGGTPAASAANDDIGEGLVLDGGVSSSSSSAMDGGGDGNGAAETTLRPTSDGWDGVSAMFAAIDGSADTEMQPHSSSDIALVEASSSPTDSHPVQNDVDLLGSGMADVDDAALGGPSSSTGTEAPIMVVPPPAGSSDLHLAQLLTTLTPSDVDIVQEVIDSMEANSSVVDDSGVVGVDTEEVEVGGEETEDVIFPPLSSLEKELFCDVDVDMTIMQQIADPEAVVGIGLPSACTSSRASVAIHDDTSDINAKESQTTLLLDQVKSQQVHLERRLDFLMRRVRKIQVTQMGEHVSNEIVGVFETVHRSLKQMKDPSSHSTSSLTGASSDALDLSTTTPAHHLFSSTSASQQQELKPMSAMSARNLIKKLDATRQAQALASARKRGSSASLFGSGSVETSAGNSGVILRGALTTTGGGSASTPTIPTGSVITMPTWPAAGKSELQRVAGQLHAQMSLAQDQVDSEATASSSGGESCDEMVNYNNPHQQYLSIQKRALWKYGTSRASIAARWSWLLSQIADLEYRIRQHTDLYRQIRASKSVVRLAGPDPDLPAETVAIAPPCTVNGYRGQLPGAVVAFSHKLNVDHSGDIGFNQEDEYGNDDPLVQCARTRPLAAFTKRKLLQTPGLHAVSKKAARPANMRCGCVRPAGSCLVCTGRTDATHPRGPTDYLSKAERVALLDPAFHPVTSQLEDASISIHMEAIMKSAEWQTRSSRTPLKPLKYSSKADRLGSASDKSTHHPSSAHETQRPGKKSADQPRRKYTKQIKTNQNSTLAPKVKGKHRGRKPGRHSAKKGRHKRNSFGGHFTSMSGDDLDDEDYVLEGSSSRGDYSANKFDSPSSSPLLATQSISGFGRRNRVDSYDIDNIVIPYSVAASTRVEKLEYKEILTPKWRIVDCPKSDKKSSPSGVSILPSQESDTDVEDVSEDAVQTRHDHSEQEEKKKFLSYLKLPLSYGRGRANRRMDSRAESSGANTPDPMSPVPPLAGIVAANAPLTIMTATTTQNTATVGISASTGVANNTCDATPVAVVRPDDSTTFVSPPGTPQSLEDGHDSIRQHLLSSTLRRRTISQSSIRLVKDGCLDHNVMEEMDSAATEPVVPPYDARQFPLSEEVYDRMLRGMPENHRIHQVNVRNQDTTGAADGTAAGSSGGSVHRFTSIAGSSGLTRKERKMDDEYFDSESTESAFGDEDPNDPEWGDEEVTFRDQLRYKR